MSSCPSTTVTVGLLSIGPFMLLPALALADCDPARLCKLFLENCIGVGVIPCGRLDCDRSELVFNFVLICRAFCSLIDPRFSSVSLFLC